MTIAELVQSSGWKNFMAKLYGFGAAVVIVGALFKIMHWPGAGMMLTVGLSVEAIIFFFSAFEPIHEEIDWTLVYPELAGITDDDEMENYKESITSNRGNVVLEKFENLFETSALSPDMIERLGEGFVKLSQTAGQMSDITEATVATQSFVTNFKGAAQSLEGMTSMYNQNSDSLKDSMSVLTDIYKKTADKIEKSGNEISEQIEKSGVSLSSSYQSLASSVNQYSNSITETGKSYNGQLDQLNKSLLELNSIYELQLKETSQIISGNKEIYSSMSGMIKNLKDTVGETERYKDEMVKLSDNLTSLNNIYGNMLSAMNFKK